MQSRKTASPALRNNRPAPFPIVGIGASAGGLEAFSELLRHLPLKTGMGFVLVQHLDPKHSSELTFQRIAGNSGPDYQNSRGRSH